MLIKSFISRSQQVACQLGSLFTRRNLQKFDSSIRGLKMNAAIDKSLVTVASARQNRLVWIDCEMTGLDVSKERIIEIAVIVTDADLKEMIEGPNLIVHQPDELLDSMDEWNTEHHGASGLTQAVRDSKVSEQQAEEKILEFLSLHTDKGKCPLAGNSVFMDKMFLMKCMPRIVEHLHYRIIDVSTIKELTKRWREQLFFNTPEKECKHRALDDIKESIKELQYYKEQIFDEDENNKASPKSAL